MRVIVIWLSVYLSICDNKEHYKYQYLHCSITFCFHHLTATWTEHCHCTGNINLYQRWEFWIDINNTKHIDYVYGYTVQVQNQFSLEKEGFRSSDWWSLARPGQASQQGDILSLLTKSGWLETLSCVELIATFLISGAQHQGSMWQRLTETKSMPNICLSWAWPGPGREMNLQCFSTIYVQVRPS